MGKYRCGKKLLQEKRGSVYKGHTTEILAVAWSPDSKYIASGSKDGQIQVWEALTGNLLHTLPTKARPLISWSPDGKYIASEEAIWDAFTGNLLHTLPIKTEQVVWSPDSRSVALFYQGALCIWDTLTQKTTHANYFGEKVQGSVLWLPERIGVAISSTKGVQVWQALPINSNVIVQEKQMIKDVEMKQAGQTQPALKILRGDVVEGIIVDITPEEILVDIGFTSPGIIPMNELNFTGYGSFDALHLNDKVLTYVLEPQTSDGWVLLSLKRANDERQWRIVKEQYEEGALLQVTVIDYNNHGLIVDISGLRGLVPISQMVNRELKDELWMMKGKELKVQIVDINRALKRLILSERKAVQESAENKEQHTGIEQAEQLFLSGQERAAGNIAGVTLERVLKKLCEINTLTAPAKAGMQALVRLLQEAKVITPQEAQRLTRLVTIRNKCAHASTISKDEVQFFIEEVKKFTDWMARQ